MPAIKVTSVNWDKVDAVLRDAVVPFAANATTEPKKNERAFPGAVMLIGCGGEVIYHKAFGCRSLLPEVSEMKPDTVFDISSLTKVLVTTSLCMYLVEQDMLEIDRRLSRIFQTFNTHGKERMTVRHLLAHTSGYAAHAPFYKRIAKADDAARCGFMSTRDAAEAVYQEIFRARLDNLPGKVAKYSDLGFILLGHAIETISSMQLGRLAQREIFSPLSMGSTGYIDLAAVKRRAVEPISDAIAPTNDCPWRKRLLCGEVQDENAWAMGGIAGHAGVFSTALDLHTFATELTECYHGRGKLFNRQVLKMFWKREEEPAGTDWALGWDTPSPRGSQAGQYFPRTAVGHLGYTGCSLWIDPEREVHIVLLSNRLHPYLDNNFIKEVRPRVHDVAMEAIGLV